MSVNRSSALGDDPYHSDDSNTLGPVRQFSCSLLLASHEYAQLPAALIEAKLLFVVWPLSRFRGHYGRPSARYLSRLTRGSPEYKAAVAAVEREKWRESRVIPARW